MNNRIALFIIFCLTRLFLPCIALAKEHGRDHDSHEHNNHVYEKAGKDTTPGSLKQRDSHTHNFTGLRFQVATEVHVAAVQPDKPRDSTLEEAGLDLHVGPNYAGRWFETTAFIGFGRSALKPLSNNYGWSIVFGGEFSAILLDPLHISTKVECESGLYSRRVAVGGSVAEYPPPFGCAIMVGPEIELVRWGTDQRSELSLELLIGLGGEKEQEKWGSTQFRLLFGIHVNL